MRTVLILLAVLIVVGCGAPTGPDNSTTFIDKNSKAMKDK